MDNIAVALFVGLVTRFVIGAWKAHGWLSARDRWAVITCFAVALTAFAVAPLVINWVMVPTAVWLIAVVLLSGGVVGAMLRWPELAWFSATHRIRRAMGVAATLVSCALFIGLAVT